MIPQKKVDRILREVVLEIILIVSYSSFICVFHFTPRSPSASSRKVGFKRTRTRVLHRESIGIVSPDIPENVLEFFLVLQFLVFW